MEIWNLNYEQFLFHWIFLHKIINRWGKGNILYIFLTGDHIWISFNRKRVMIHNNFFFFFLFRSSVYMVYGLHHLTSFHFKQVWLPGMHLSSPLGPRALPHAIITHMSSEINCIHIYIGKSYTMLFILNHTTVVLLYYLVGTHSSYVQVSGAEGAGWK